MTDKYSIALALGGGAAKGLAHIGVLKALEEAAVIPTVMSGTSMGCLVGAMYAVGMPVDEIEEVALNVNMATTLQLFRPAFRANGFVEDRKILELLEDIYGQTRIEDLPRPFIACAVDFRTGRTHYIDSGRLLDAVRASISIPGIFLPVKANGTLLVDGGLTKNLPLSILRQFQPQRLIGVNVVKTPEMTLDSTSGPIKLDFESREEETLAEKILKAFDFNNGTGAKTKVKPKQNTLQHTLLQSFHILQNALTEAEIAIIKPNLMIEPDMTPVNLWEFWKSQEAIEIGYTTARKALENFS